MSTVTDKPRVLIIGVGNLYRADDAAGRHAARRLREACAADVSVIELDGEAADLLDAWEGSEFVILLEALAAAGPPGGIRRFEVGLDPIPLTFDRSSTHALGVGEAIALAQALGRLPPRLVIYGIVGERFDWSETLSPAVEAGLADLVDRVLAEVDAC